jgi:nitrate/nitrite-specific signal transduction histidine kinase
MLRRKLLLNLGPIVALMLVTAIVAIWLLQGVWRDFSHLNVVASLRDPSSSQTGASDSQEALLTRFRWLVLGLAMVFLVIINFSVIVLVRLGSLILRPVDQLLIATRQLRAEHFEHRVTLDGNDEFDELAQAYNSLAEQLQANERKRIETLAQAAVMMNHELNNAIAIIDLQLAMLSRQNTGANPAIEKCLRQIQDGLGRMTQTVRSLMQVRRIVLTDYTPGMKMLDLQRSVQEESDQAGPQRSEDRHVVA